MAQTLTGTLDGSTIILDQPGRGARQPSQRVRVVVEPLDDVDQKLSREENARLWKEWVDNGPQGPIED